MYQKTDEEIAILVQQGDTESFGFLIERYQNKLVRYGRKFLANGYDIEDLVQDIFIKTYKNINSYNSKMKFSPWIYRIAHNEFVNALKRKSIIKFIPLDFDEFLPTLHAKETADQEINDKELKDLMQKGLGQVPEKYREILALYYFEEFSYQEIADILHIPTSTVGIRLSRGKTLLKKYFEKNNHGQQ